MMFDLFDFRFMIFRSAKQSQFLVESKYILIMKVRKTTKELQDFDPEKLSRSLQQAGATEAVANDILWEIERTLYEGISTRKIYRKAFQMLKKRSKPIAARYQLGKAIMDLGPSGYPFEQFVSELFKADGYRVQVGQTLPGRCVTHEVDVLAEKTGERHFVECKFHSSHHYKISVQIPLYVNARFHDLAAAWRKEDGMEGVKFQGWLFTNTKFTEDAARYGVCSGLQLCGWRFPKGNSLEDWVERAGLHPISCMTTLTKAEKQALFGQRVVLARELCRFPDWLKNIHISGERREAVLKEARILCGKN